MIILASNSEARIRLLRSAGLEFRHRTHRALEDMKFAAEAPAERAGRLAREKALSLKDVDKEDVIIGSDQVLSYEGTILSKASTRDELRSQLRLLRGRSHFLHSAVACVQEGRLQFETTVTARLKMRHFSDEFLERYLAAEGRELLGCVGGYRIEAKGIQLFEEVEGDSSTVQGIPLLPLLGFLRSRSLIAS